MGKVTVVGGKVGMEVPRGFPKVGTPLNDLTWEEIRMISDAGLASEYFSVGDRKEIILNGRVGALTLTNHKTYAFIIGIDHNANLEGTNRIHFQLAKTALTGGTDVAFCDSSYNTDSGGGFVMNSGSTNTGGWSSSTMRTNVCNAMLSVVPEELRAVCKSVTKYTDNTGKRGTTAEAVTATTDYFFLLSVYEAIGSVGNGNQNEAAKQAVYAYYAAGNSEVKYNHASTGSAVTWWTRSPSTASISSFQRIKDNGGTSQTGSNYSFGFAPAFCV